MQDGLHPTQSSGNPQRRTCCARKVGGCALQPRTLHSEISDAWQGHQELALRRRPVARRTRAVARFFLASGCIRVATLLWRALARLGQSLGFEPSPSQRQRLGNKLRDHRAGLCWAVVCPPSDNPSEPSCSIPRRFEPKVQKLHGIFHTVSPSSTKPPSSPMAPARPSANWHSAWKRAPSQSTPFTVRDEGPPPTLVRL